MRRVHGCDADEHQNGCCSQRIGQRGACTPSQAVRALWEVITVQGALPPALVRALNSNGDLPSRQEDPTEMESTSGAEIVSSFYRRLGIDEPSSTPVDYAELREMAADEQLASWGLS